MHYPYAKDLLSDKGAWKEKDGVLPGLQEENGDLIMMTNFIRKNADDPKRCLVPVYR